MSAILLVTLKKYFPRLSWNLVSVPDYWRWRATLSKEKDFLYLFQAAYAPPKPKFWIKYIETIFQKYDNEKKFN